ncbi:MAG: divalent-cation tolerance protein CutA [Alphaproteobacteria bacterium GM7ARS4]|nr:divalent-cation tolerance protein CutA [Alphaproteobacteria bacterium GM7ARS4]
MSLSYCMVYMTAPSADEAQTIAQCLIQERLAACVHLCPPIEALFVWQGLQKRTEYPLMAKTTSQQQERLCQRAKELHSDSCPGIVVLPICHGVPDFLAWIKEQTTPPAPS